MSSMTLAELTTAYERRQIIDYASDGISTQCRRHEMQHVEGPLYKGRERAKKGGEPQFKLFLVFDGIEKGLVYDGGMRHPEWYRIEDCMETLQRIGYDTLDHFLAAQEESIRRDRHIGSAIIEFVRQFDPMRADRYAQYRLDRYARKAEEARQRQLEDEAKEEAKKAKREAELAAERAKLLGWADEMISFQFGRIMTVLGKQVRVEGTVMPWYQFAQWALQNGWTPHKEENVTSWYGSKWDRKESRPRTEYRLQKGSSYYKVSKTVFDFASYLAGKGFCNSSLPESGSTVTESPDHKN